MTSPEESSASAGNGRAVLAVEDDGVGRALPSDMPRTSAGLGRMIVRAMATKLGAEWGQDEAHRGMRVFLSFPVAPAHSA